MADYFNPGALDTGMKGSWQDLVSGPSVRDVLREREKQNIADQMYQQALTQGQLGLESAQRKGIAEQQTEDILSKVRTDPRYGQALQQAMINEQLGAGGTSGLKYLQAVQEARDTAMAPMFETKDPRVQEYLLRTGGQTLGQLGLTSPELPTSLQEAFPLLQAQNARYRRSQEFQAKRDLQQQEIDARRILEEIQQREANRRAQMRAASAGGVKLPKTLDAAFIQSFVAANGRMPSTAEIAAYLSQKPQNVPELAGEKKSAQLQADPMYAITQGIVNRLQQQRPDLFGGTPSIPQRGAAAPAAGPKGFTSKGGVKFTVE